MHGDIDIIMHVWYVSCEHIYYICPQICEIIIRHAYHGHIRRPKNYVVGGNDDFHTPFSHETTPPNTDKGTQTDTIMCKTPIV